MRKHSFLRFLLVGLLAGVFFNMGPLCGAPTKKAKKAVATKVTEKKEETAAEKEEKEAKAIAEKAAKEKAAKEKELKAATEKAAKAAKLAANKAAKEKVAKEKAEKAAVKETVTGKKSATKAIAVVKAENKQILQIKAPLSNALPSEYWLTKDGKYLALSSGTVITTDVPVPGLSRFKLIPVKESVERTGGITYAIVVMRETEKPLCLANENGKLTLHEYVDGVAVAATEGWNQMTGLRYPDTALRNAGITLNSGVIRLTGFRRDEILGIEVENLFDSKSIDNTIQNLAAFGEKILKNPLFGVSGDVKLTFAKKLSDFVESNKTAFSPVQREKFSQFVLQATSDGFYLLTPAQKEVVRKAFGLIAKEPLMPQSSPGAITYTKAKPTSQPITCVLKKDGSYLKVDGSKLVAASSREESSVVMLISLELSMVLSGSNNYAIVYGTPSTGVFNVQRTTDGQMDLSTRYIIGALARENEIWSEGVYPGGFGKLKNGDVTLEYEKAATVSPVPLPELEPQPVPTPGPSWGEKKKATKARGGAKLCKLSLPEELDKYIQMADMGMGSPVLLRIPERDKATDFRVTTIPLDTTGYAKYSVEFDALGKSWRLRGTDVESSAFAVVAASTPFDEKLDVWGHVVVPDDMKKLHNGDKTLIMADVQSQPMPSLPMFKKIAIPVQPNEVLLKKGSVYQRIENNEFTDATGKDNASKFVLVDIIAPTGLVGASNYALAYKDTAGNYQGVSYDSVSNKLILSTYQIGDAEQREIWAVVRPANDTLTNFYLGGSFALTFERVSPVIQIDPAAEVTGVDSKLIFNKTANHFAWCVLKRGGQYITVDETFKVAGTADHSKALAFELIHLAPSSELSGANYYAIVHGNASIGLFSLQRTVDNQLNLSERYLLDDKPAKDTEIWSEGVYPGGFGKLKNGDVELEYEKREAPAPFVLPQPEVPFEITLAGVASLFDPSSIDKTIQNLAVFTDKISVSFTNLEGGLSDLVVRLRQFFMENVEKLSEQQRGRLLEFLPKVSALFGGDEQAMVTEVISKLSQSSVPSTIATQEGGDLVL